MEERNGDNLNGKNLTGTSVLVLAGPGRGDMSRPGSQHQPLHSGCKDSQ